MQELISKVATDRLVSFPAEKKLGFLILLYERMAPALYAFSKSEGRDSSVFEHARREFWRTLEGVARAVSWIQLQEDILNATHDSENFGSLEASFALNSALVAAEIAGFLADGKDTHLVDAQSYTFNSLGALVSSKMGVRAYDRGIVEAIKTHPMVQREARKEEDDIAFLNELPKALRREEICSALLRRAETQSSIFVE